MFFHKNVKIKKRFSVILLVLFLVFTNNIIFNQFIKIWEVEGKKQAEIENFDIGIVLGGMFEYNQELDRLSIRRGGDRLWQALDLYHRNKVDKLLISGNNGFIVDNGLNEALQIQQLLFAHGIPKEDVIIESNSKNTYQNAVESMKVLANTSGSKSILLITSASHMRRSAACFSKVGLENFSTYSTDHYYDRKSNYNLSDFIIPNISVLNDWNVLMHEVVGSLVYKMMGYI